MGIISEMVQLIKSIGSVKKYCNMILININFMFSGIFSVEMRKSVLLGKW